MDDDSSPLATARSGLYVVHLSIHGLIRGENLELGGDSDTGGQCKYVVELAKCMGEHPNVERVDLLTRRIIDPKVSPDYAELHEVLSEKANIFRIEAGPRRYFRKESLWRYLDVFADRCLAFFRHQGAIPDVIHAHYADAGYVGARLARLLGRPFIFTAHSLGKSKLERLLESGMETERAEKKYNLAARIEAEEYALDSAQLICTSTRQERDEQYAQYACYQPDQMRVIPPGVDLSRFKPPAEAEVSGEVIERIERFYADRRLPTILAIARADEKKNLSSLVRAYGESPELREKANLLIIAGNRDKLTNLTTAARRVWTDLLKQIDDYDLYGSISIPKFHTPDEIPHFYRYAAKTKGVFVNPAFVEPFGLTLIEAAASGLPIVATDDGGPRDIIANCENGELISAFDPEGIGKAILKTLSDPFAWKRLSDSGLQGVRQHYQWRSHVETYLKEVEPLVNRLSSSFLSIAPEEKSSLLFRDRLVFTGQDKFSSLEESEAVVTLKQLMLDSDRSVGFGIATGRSLNQALSLYQEQCLPHPDVVISHLGGEIHYGRSLEPDTAWQRHINHRWERDKILKLLDGENGLSLQSEDEHQHQFKISYDWDSNCALTRQKIQRLLRSEGIEAQVVLSDQSSIDIIPPRSGKGNAIRNVLMKWGISPENTLMLARRGSDYEALSGTMLAVLPKDHKVELQQARFLPRVYVSERPGYAGLLDGVRKYRFFDEIRLPAVGEKQDASMESVVAIDTHARVAVIE